MARARFVELSPDGPLVNVEDVSTVMTRGDTMGSIVTMKNGERVFVPADYRRVAEKIRWAATPPGAPSEN